MSMIKAGMTAVCVLGVGLFSQPAAAAIVQVDASAVVDLSDSALDEVAPVGTLVSMSVQLDVGAGMPSEAFSIVNVLGGAYTWNNGGPQSFNVSGKSSISSSLSGNMEFTFIGSGPSIGGVTVANATLQLNIGTDPSVSTEQLSDLLLSQTTISSLGFRLSSGGSPSGLPKRFSEDIAGSLTAEQVSVVPLPASLLFLLSGVAGLSAMGLRRRA